MLNQFANLQDLADLLDWGIYFIQMPFGGRDSTPVFLMNVAAVAVLAFALWLLVKKHLYKS